VKGRRPLVGVTAALLAVLAASLVTARALSSDDAFSGMLVFTQVPVDTLGPMSGRTRIVAIDPAGGANDVLVLTGDFHAARAPAISPDGERMAYSARRTSASPWQIWEMALRSRKARLITSGSGSFTEPAYLADGRVVFSGVPDGTGRTPALYTAPHEEGEREGRATRITFHPSADVAPQVLADGQVLFTSVADSASGAGAALMMVRSDGTGIRLFYSSSAGRAPAGRPWETTDGGIVFVESTRDHPSGGEARGALVSVSKARPLHSRSEASEGMDGSFRSVYPLPSGTWLVSYRAAGAERFSLREFDPGRRRLGRVVGDDSAYHAVDPVMAIARPRPRMFESVVDTAKATGHVYCVDANFTTASPALVSPSPRRTARRVRIETRDGVRDVPLAEDGSFYVELPANTPVRLETVDGDGRTVRGPSAWFWVRPNEKRGCIGCHEDRELAPPNRVPLAVTQPPVPLIAPAAKPSVAGGGPR